jgi:peptidyl-prolyl cis-trans isomerase B (cyclophilin B)
MIKTKIAIFSLAIFALSSIYSYTAVAAPKDKQFKLNCKATKAKGHIVKNILPPEVKGPYKNKLFNILTNCGDIVIEAFGANAPVTVAAMSALAKGGYFDQTLCHRLTTSESYLLHCGDPTATGMGAPSFEYDNENLPINSESNYSTGVVGVWNSENMSNGGQFFIVYNDSTLPPNYTIWGKVIKGLEIVKAVAKDGVIDGKAEGSPKRKIAIERVRVR